MDKISCDIYLDLIPLVKDGIASEDSTKLVIEHIKSCDSCKEVYEGVSESILNEELKLDDKKIIQKIKSKLMIISFVTILVGSIVGVVISNGMGMFYNVLIMPTIGALAYLTVRNRAVLVSGFIFLLSIFGISLSQIIDGELKYCSILEIVSMSSFWAIIYTFLSLLGIIIATLLYFAFKKEKNYES